MVMKHQDPLGGRLGSRNALMLCLATSGGACPTMNRLRYALTNHHPSNGEGFVVEPIECNLPLLRDSPKS